ncbi:MAG: hypothetical protein AB7E09_06905 [Candidatus Izemoplasmatales bacterium]
MYTFYFDESYHDRRISLKENKLNIFHEEASDTFTYCFIGFDTSNEKNLEQKFLEVENKLRTTYDYPEDKELKGKNISKKYYKRGFASLRSELVEFYSGIFNVLSENNVLLHIGTLSKTEYMINQLLDKWFKMNERLLIDFNVNVNSTKYTLTKLIYNHRESRVIQQIYERPSEIGLFMLKQYLIQLMDKLIEINKDNERTKDQTEAFKQVLFIVQFMDTQFKAVSINDKMDYNAIFKGLTNFIYLEHINKEQVIINIDREKEIEKCAKKNAFKVGTKVESEDYILLRICDFIANLFGRLLQVIQNEFLEPEFDSIDDLTSDMYKEKREFPKEWFKLNKKQFELYQDINNYLVKLNNFFVIYTGRYSDDVIVLTSLIQYIGFIHEKFDAFDKISLEEHQERFNSYYMRRLYDHFERLSFSD